MISIVIDSGMNITPLFGLIATGSPLRGKDVYIDFKKKKIPPTLVRTQVRDLRPHGLATYSISLLTVSLVIS